MQAIKVPIRSASIADLSERDEIASHFDARQHLECLPWGGLQELNVESVQ
jgi:hypothetical protein